VALLSSFSITDNVHRLLAHSLGNRTGRLVDDDLRRSALFDLAKELGVAYGRTDGLRRSVDLEPDPVLLDRLEFGEVHRRGEVVVAATLHTLLTLWSLRIVAYDASGTTYLERTAEEGAKAADQLLGMIMRAIDYLPPVDLEFDDLVDAIALADEAVVPSQRLDYRTTLLDAFAAFGLTLRKPGTAAPVRLDRLPLDYRNINPRALVADKAEVYRFLWQNADQLGFPRLYYTEIDSIQPVSRTGPDGLIVHETIATYTQRLDGSARAIGEHSDGQLRVPRGMKANAEVELWGGGVVVFDGFGRARLHLPQPVNNWARQRRVLERLATFDLASYGSVGRERSLAELHNTSDGW
jgi:hypothetical protein